MPIELFANAPSTVVSAGGTTTSDTSFTVSTPSVFPSASNSAVPATQFRITDPALPTEVMLVTNVSGSTWTVTRGAEGTTAVAHVANWTAVQVVSAGTLQQFKQATNAVTSAVTVATSTTETVLASYQPYTGEVVSGTAFEAIAFGTFGFGGATRPVMTWRLRWGGVAGTQLCSIVTGTNAPALGQTTAATGASWDVNGSVNFLSATSVTANLNCWYNGAALSTAASNAVSSSASSGVAAAPITVSGAGPLVLTFQWGTSASYNSLIASSPMIYRAA